MGENKNVLNNDTGRPLAARKEMELTANNNKNRKQNNSMCTTFIISHMAWMGYWLEHEINDSGLKCHFSSWFVGCLTMYQRQGYLYSDVIRKWPGMVV